MLIIIMRRISKVVKVISLLVTQMNYANNIISSPRELFIRMISHLVNAIVVIAFDCFDQLVQGASVLTGKAKNKLRIHHQ